MAIYNPAKIEKKWQKYWDANKLHQAADFSDGKRNFMLLVEFPYPSGDLHTGHWYAFAVPDIYGRYLSMIGYNVMYPIGFDAFGLPAENAAIKRNIHPRDWTKKNIKTMTKQLQSMGARFDWSRAVSTIEPEYYRWTQWIFLQLHKAGLAYRAKTAVNWCSQDKTVLANEQVVDGKCERCGTAVQQRELSQWMFKITSFADRLVDDMKDLDWPDATKKAQENWIGRSEGAVITFPIKGMEKAHIKVFTTRLDTIFGVTFLVISPEMAQKWIDSKGDASAEVRDYVAASLKKTELERQENKEKTGVDTGVKAINPMTGEEIPVWVADYVLGHYGTGQIMAVPAHDERDFEFAKKYDLPVRVVIEPQELNIIARPDDEVAIQNEKNKFLRGEKPYLGSGQLINSGNLNGLIQFAATRKILEVLKEKGLGEEKKNYRLHDWVLSRQRYWGVPIPMIHCADCGYVPVPEDKLPVKLPSLDNFLPADDGRSPLAKAEKWLKVKCPQCGKPAERETDTMDTFVDSSWYYMRYADPANEETFAAKDTMARWLPVPMYFGGAEHNTMHLLYSRFVTKALRSLNLVDFPEPFIGRRNHGLILGPDGQKMSKSKGNVVDPDKEVAKYGADTVRMYFAFLGPYDQNYAWNFNGVLGIRRFLDRIWNFFERYNDAKLSETGSADIPVAIHRAIKEVGENIKFHRFNTGVSGLMKLLNELEDASAGQKLAKEQYEVIVKLLAPFAPHIAEELWAEVLANEPSVHHQPWPEYDQALLGRQEVRFIVQINGKVRGALAVTPGRSEAEIDALARADENIVRHLAGQTVKKTVFVPDKLINFVV
ncbi:MAG TPA: leucine--tRNA ligase [Candidatus Paceibacterota bacterium]|nr:leucine--tRNA ligase [Candidatus Paceibacterota bacterium]